jgi:hypothetical protein
MVAEFMSGQQILLFLKYSSHSNKAILKYITYRNRQWGIAIPSQKCSSSIRRL